MNAEMIVRAMGANGLYIGYDALLRCINRSLEDPDRLLALQKEVYAVVAGELGITVSCLKRRMDILLGVMWRQASEKQWRRLGLSPVYKPSVGEFLEGIVWFIKTVEKEQQAEYRRRHRT